MSDTEKRIVYLMNYLFILLLGAWYGFCGFMGSDEGFIFWKVVTKESSHFAVK